MQQPPLPARFGQQLGVVTTLYRSVIERLLVPHDMTWPQFSLLLHLARRAAPGRISEIAVAVDLTQSAVTKIVQKFMAQGLLEVGRDSHDARNRLVQITAVGVDRLTTIQRSFAPVFGDLLEGWNVEDLERLVEDLTRLSNQLVALNDTNRRR